MKKKVKLRELNELLVGGITSNTELAQRLGVHRNTIQNWRNSLESAQFYGHGAQFSERSAQKSHPTSGKNAQFEEENCARAQKSAPDAQENCAPTAQKPEKIVHMAEENCAFSSLPAQEIVHFFCLPNLSSQKIEKRHPWEFPHPGYRFKSKSDFRSWCEDISTRHLFYNLTEGTNPHLRAARNNKPIFLHGLIADYDAVPDGDPLLLIEKRAPAEMQPAWLSRTFSGGVRLVWLFDRPLPIHTRQILERALRQAKKTLRLNRLLAGFDEKAFLDPVHYYEAGTEWKQLDGV